jgi:hypothetical protein
MELALLWDAARKGEHDRIVPMIESIGGHTQAARDLLPDVDVEAIARAMVPTDPNQIN